tara:strand:- start:4434 stop:5315 length:882 start_codon:yes stop_codon:yes gene_type:complete
MAINTTTVETNLTTKLNATTGTTDAKEFLLLGKAVEALTPTVTVNSVITEGNTQVSNVQNEGTTQVAAVQAAASGFAALTGATFTGAVTIPDLTVTGTTTSINTTTLDVADKNITIADGAPDAAAADGAGITVEGANATLTYASASDNWSFNKGLDITTELSQIATISEQVHIDTGTGGTTTLHMKDGKAVIYFTNNQASNAQINLKGDGSTTLDSLLAVGDSVTVALLYTQGGTAYYVDAIQVDGTTANTTTKWVGGAPTGGNANAIDTYTVTVIKTASGTFTALASLSKYE